MMFRYTTIFNDWKQIIYYGLEYRNIVTKNEIFNYT